LWRVSFASQGFNVRIAEIYASIQGEGLLAGQESAFVRASGCNLRCWYCDTPYASWRPEGDDLAVEQIVERVAALGCRHVVLTGGEPMLFSELIPLCDRLHERGLHITIETAGTLYLPLACDLMSISPKLTNSSPGELAGPAWRERHERGRHTPEIVRRLMSKHTYQLKFVIDAGSDLEEVESYLLELGEYDSERVLLMPQGTDAVTLAKTGQWLEPLCQRRGYTFCPRKQIVWFGLTRGT
jgi:7-carboxy-7-deazaguanine synthase